MVLGWDWPEIYKILARNWTQGYLYERLIGEEALDESPDEAGDIWDLEALACRAQLRQTQWREPIFRTIWETKVNRHE